MKILIVGSGLYGAVFAHEATKRGHQVTVIEKRNHIAGNIYTEEIDGIQVHKYGAHIFHTSNKKVWDYIQQFAEFNRYTNSPVANYKGHMYNLPFNMNTFSEMWGVRTPQEAMDKINEQRKEIAGKEPQNLEEQAISLIGRDIYEKLIKGYTEKQWGRKATDLPPFIIKRLPVRLTYDNNYFNDDYQGIPKGGYTQIVEKMLDNPNITVKLNTDFFDKKDEYLKSFDKIVYTGPIDQFFDYKLGHLEYRSLRFETEEKNVGNYQGNAVINYTEAEIPYTRIIEHKHFEFGKGDEDKTIITREYPAEWKPGDEPYYPVNDDKNNELYAEYKDLADKEDKVIFGGRLGQYKYYNMDQVIAASLEAFRKWK
ncbi:UDP-galactopyranose mutase [Lactobacillus colini]|uniref:UDP-galactopyranose mutase n=1 Tax=Lactobacillus colini TaxID=1819254 RepID=A0ABS4MB97_9LACO|nr:UDP-galactopyranose mutase [Lactobacillus colini]MBP2056943.1 UDP-galactopyranose mutase [Lactobacillus colini]